METSINWDLELDELASDQLLLSVAAVDRSHPWIVGVTWKNWGRMAIRTLAEARRLSAVAAGAKVLAGGLAPEDFSLATVLETIQPKVGDKEEDLRVADELGTGEWNRLAYATTIDCLRSVRSSNPHPPMFGPFQGYELAQLEGIAIPITVLGVAALAASAYYLAEHSEDAAVVEVEKAWAMARAYSEIRVAEAQIAAGQVPQLSDWAGARAKVAAVTESSWWPYAAIGTGVVLLGGAAYLGATAYQEQRANPCAAYRPQADMRGKAPSRARTASSSRRASSRRTSARRPSSSTSSRANPSRAEFVAQAMAGGASRAQAGRLWRGYLSAQRAKAGRAGGKARARRRNPNGDAGPVPSRSIQVTEKIQGLPVPSGSKSSRETSSAPSSSKRAAKPRRASPKPKPAGSSSSSKTAKRARKNASAPASSPRRAAPKRQSATAKKGRSQRPGARARVKPRATARK